MGPKTLHCKFLDNFVGFLKANTNFYKPQFLFDFKKLKFLESQDLSL